MSLWKRSVISGILRESSSLPIPVLIPDLIDVEERAIQSSFFVVHPLTAGVGSLLVMTKQRLTEEENLEQLDRDFITLTDTFHVRKIVLDLNSVLYMTSAAIGKLIALHRRLARTEGRLVLCSLQPEVRETLTTSHLLTYFSVADSSQSATSQLA